MKTKDEENRELVLAKNFDKLLSTNKGYIFKIVDNYNQPDHYDDMKQEAALGLLEAMNRFNPEHSIQFITYAAIWMRKYCTRFLTTNARTVYLPKNKIQEQYLHREFSLDKHKLILEDKFDTEDLDDEEKQLRDNIMNHLHSLKDIYRDVIINIVVLDKSFKEISDEIGISKQGVAARYKLAMRNLRELVVI